ncbi:hypothetical protein ACFWUP_05580 [Nocardia sp. NPDC058658]|uniref:hypothetical protein n=1 Tax=Nocardia sp. NPDC058658 TaxID=3346580 RepID=UPI0036515B1F
MDVWYQFEMRWWRGIVVSVGVGVVLSGCSPRPSTLDKQVEVFADLPLTCAEIDPAATGALRLFGRGLSRHAEGLTGEPRSHDRLGQSLRCLQTFEDPIPEGADLPTTGAMRRSVVIEVQRSTFPHRPWETTTTIAPDGRSSDVIDRAQLPGVGQDSTTWFTRGREGDMSAHTKTRIDNLTIGITTSGADWHDSSLTARDSPELRADLRTGADAIAREMAATLPARLPRVTTGAFELLPTPAVEPTLRVSTPTITAWDPCALAGPIAVGAGLPGDRTDVAGIETRGCFWSTSWGFVQVRSRAMDFEQSIYRSEYSGAPKPVTFATRTAIQVEYPSDSHERCTHAFDTPFGTTEGRLVGVVTIEAHVVRGASRQRACDLLTPLSAGLTPHLPSSR